MAMDVSTKHDWVRPVAMLRSSALALVLGGALAVAAGCGGDDEKEPAPATPKVADLAQAVCELMFRCCARGEVNVMLGPYVTADNCAQRLLNWTTYSSGGQLDLQDVIGEPVALQFYNLAALERATSEERGWIDGNAVQACLAFLSDASCNEVQEVPEVEGCVPPEPPPDPGPCDPDAMFVGLVKEGEACSSPGTSLECEEGLTCKADGQYGVFGECVRLGRIGDVCFNDVECQAELYCSQLYGTCEAYRQEGETCAYSDRDSLTPDPATLLVACDPELGLTCDTLSDTCVLACHQGASCATDDDCGHEDDPDLQCILGRCDRPRAEGLPCGQDDDCGPDLACNLDPNDGTESLRVCLPQLESGEPCIVHNQCLSEFCDPEERTCAARVDPDSPCPSGDSAQCRNGRCIQEPVSLCAEDADCPISGYCNPLTLRCGWYCVALRPDNADCVADTDCVSGDCVQERCRTLPLGNGEACDEDEDCESEFCNVAEDDPHCQELPLALGTPCWSHQQCESLVCFAPDSATQSTCVVGREEGEACDPNDPSVEPCSPHQFYCDDWDAETPHCVRLLETGAACERSAQCRGECAIIVSRRLCTSAVREGRVICDGED